MIRKFYYIAALSICTLYCTAGCSDEDTIPYEIPDGTEEKNTTDPNKIEYDDGENIIFNIKIAIDREGVEYKNGDMQWFKDNLRKQWDEINERFNALDKENKLWRNYKFVPDLEDIIVYSHSECDHWDAPVYAEERGRLDKTKFQCMVTYDFVDQVGEGGGGCGNYEGIGNILVVHADDNPNFTDHLTDYTKNGTTSIVHELGHFRGNIDTYCIYLNKEDNPFNDMEFQPVYGNMNNPYGPTDAPESLWNDYEIKVINAAGAKKDQRLIYTTMRDYFADAINITVTDKATGNPIDEEFTVRFYEIKNGKFVDTTQPLPQPIESRTKVSEENPLELDAYELFWTADRNTYPWAYYDMLWVEAETESGAKGYAFLPNYHVHNQGLDDKLMNPDFEGRSIYNMTIEVE